MHKKPEYKTFAFSVDLANNSAEEMWKDISTFLQIAQKYNNICVVKTEIQNEIVVVEYEHDENIEGWGCDNPYWISYDEMMDIEFNRDPQEVKSEKE